VTFRALLHMLLKFDRVFQCYKQNPPYCRTLLTNSQNFVTFFLGGPTFIVHMTSCVIPQNFDSNSKIFKTTDSATLTSPSWSTSALWPATMEPTWNCHVNIFFVSWVHLTHNCAIIMPCRGIKMFVTGLLCPRCLN
jgi:hypothetical protein